MYVFLIYCQLLTDSNNLLVVWQSVTATCAQQMLPFLFKGFFPGVILSVKTSLRKNDIICKVTALQHFHFFIEQSICCGLVGHIHISLKIIIEYSETG